jgi:hypothetical protein
MFKKKGPVYRVSYVVVVVVVVSGGLTLLNDSILEVKQQFAAQWLRREIK